MFSKISKVIINNFQAHEHFEEEFENFTAIIGPSDKGKSSIFRAMVWCLYNSPSGDDFITRGKNKCSVTVIFNNGLQITRARGTGHNYYEITQADGNKIHLEGFGTGPVDEVVNAHGMRELDYFGEKQALNLCRQLDRPFFLGETPTTRAVMIGHLANTEVVDLSIKNTSSDIRQAKASLKSYKADLKEVKSSLSEIKGLAMMEKSIGAAEKRLDKLMLLEGKMNNISTIAKKITELNIRREKYIQIMESEADINDALELLDKIDELKSICNKITEVSNSLNKELSKKETLQKIIDKADIGDIDTQLDNLDKIISHCKEVSNIKNIKTKLDKAIATKNNLEDIANFENIDGVIENIDSAVKLISVLNNITSTDKKFKSALVRKEKGEAVIKTLEGEFESRTNEYKQALRELGACPTCMSKISEEQLSNIEENL